MPTKSSSARRASNGAAKSDEAVSYNEFKEYEGQKYKGMKVGRSHKWYYDKGEWKEKKITPDLWQISYTVTKRRAGCRACQTLHEAARASRPLGAVAGQA